VPLTEAFNSPVAMSLQLYFTFLAACFVLALTPGPNMSLFIANGTAHGMRAALLTVFGASLGLSVLVALATIGMTSAMTVMAEWFDVIRWVGASYLVWLGIGRLRAAFAAEALSPAPAPPGGRYVWQGAAVSLSNPKVLLFLGAFFPQFVDPSAPLAPQLTLMAITFVVALAGVDSCLAMAVGAARGWFTTRRKRYADGISGVLLCGGGLWLAVMRRT
jgi:homoserine/homoserine lactone efflux protein